MQEHTANPPQYKTCIRGEKCIHPDGPTLPLTEFYKQRGARDGLSPVCKECKKKESALYTKKRGQKRGKAGHPSEKLVIDRLRSFGVYAVPGKSSEWHWIDVVAWGCVRIEVKAASVNARGVFTFNMGKKRGKEKDRSDLVVLVMLYDEDPRFFVLESAHPVFYHPDGRPKLGVGHATNGGTPKNGHGVVLNAELLSASEDRWELVEERRLEIAREVRERGVVTLAKSGDSKQLSLLRAG